MLPIRASPQLSTSDPELVGRCSRIQASACSTVGLDSPLAAHAKVFSQNRSCPSKPASGWSRNSQSRRVDIDGVDGRDLRQRVLVQCRLPFGCQPEDPAFRGMRRIVGRYPAADALHHDERSAEQRSIRFAEQHPRHRYGAVLADRAHHVELQLQVIAREYGRSRWLDAGHQGMLVTIPRRVEKHRFAGHPVRPGMVTPVTSTAEVGTHVE